MTEKRKYRTFTPEQKLAIVLAGLRGDKSVKELCRDHQISETLYYSWRDQLLEAGKERYAGAKGAASETTELRRKVVPAGAGAGPQDVRAGDRGGTLARLGVSERAARSRELVAAGYRPAVVARVARISRQAIYRVPRRRPASEQRPLGRRPTTRRAGDRRDLPRRTTTRPTATA